MTSIRLPYIQHFRDRHGKDRFYFRRPGSKRVALQGAPGSPEFIQAYQSALAHGQERLDGRKSTQGSISSLIAAYYESGAFKGSATSTRSNHRRILERFRSRFGEFPVAELDKASVEKLL